MVYRVRLAKLEPVMFVSHLGIMRSFERAVRRADLPVAYSGGYHPHPKISFAIALGVGMTSEAEYVDIELLDDETPLGAAQLLQRLNDALPPGLEAIAAARVEGQPALAASVAWASYRVDVPKGVADAAARFMNLDHYVVEVTGKGGPRQVDIRPLVHSLKASGASGRGDGDGDGRYNASVEFTVACGGRAHLRPGEVMSALGSLASEPVRGDGVGVHRTGLFFDIYGELVLPIEHECKDLVIAVGQ